MNPSPFLVFRVVATAAVLIVSGATNSRGQPANDMFANRYIITGTNIVVTGSNVGATKELGEPDHDGDSGGASIWWSWRAPMNGVATVSTEGSSFDTVLGVYTGSSVSALTRIASDDDGGANFTSKVSFDVVANQTYQIAVDGFEGDSGSVMLSVLFSPPLPMPPAPSWCLPDLDGTMIYSSNFAGKVVIVDFWATWCSPCKAGMPDLVALQSKYGADGLVVVGANVSWSGESARTISDFLTTFTPTINYQVVMSDAATENMFGDIQAIPTTFIIDRQNRIQKKYLGTQSFGTLEKQIIPLLYSNTRIAFQQNGSQMTLCWPTNTVGFTLQSAADLVSPVWSDWPVAPTASNGTDTVQVPVTSPQRYFRLRMTY